MGYKGYGPHRQWVTWAMGYRSMGKWVMGPMGNLHPKYQKDVKMSSSQKDVKCQIVKHLDYGGGSQKKK